VGGALAQVLVAQHPRDARTGAGGGRGRGGGQDLEGGGVGHEDEVARSGDLLDADAGVAQKVHGDRVAGVEEEGARAEVHAVAQDGTEGLRGQGLGAGDAVRVAEDQAYEIDVVQAGFDLFGRRALLIAPQGEFGGERGTPHAALSVQGGPGARIHRLQRPFGDVEAVAGRLRLCPTMPQDAPGTVER
jgi:hypothetical protein